MLNVLVPIDGSENSERAVKLLLRKPPLFMEPLEVYLLNVQLPFPGTIRGVHQEAEQEHQERGLQALTSARRILDEAGVRYNYDIGVGDPAHVIAHYVKDNNIQQIVMGSRGLGTIPGLLLGSVTTKVIHLTDVPVLIIK